MIMTMKRHNLIIYTLILFLIFSFSSCNKGGPAKKQFKAFNTDKNKILDDQEFFKAVADSSYFENWQQDNNQTLSEDEWSTGINEYLGGYKISTVGKFGTWDLDGDKQLSKGEFMEGLFAVVDEDNNHQISETEYITWSKEGRGKGKSSGNSSGG
jgi:hypothetical protein